MKNNIQKIRVKAKEILNLERIYGVDVEQDLVDLEIVLEEESRLVLNLANLNTSGSQKIRLVHEGRKSVSEIRYIISLQGVKEFDLDLKVELAADVGETEVHLKAVQSDSSRTKMYGDIQTLSGVQNVKGNLQEEVILLGKKARTNLTPVLEVASEEVQMQHGVKVANLDESSLFYLMSRGMSRNEAETMLFDGFLREIYAKFEGKEVIEANL